MFRRIHELSAHLLGWPDEALEQLVELLPLGLREPSEELQGVGVDGLLGAGLRLPSGRGERNHVRTPVVHVPLALDVTGALELVDQGDHRRAVDPQLLSDRLLGEPAVAFGLVPEKREDSEVLDGEAERLERSVMKAKPEVRRGDVPLA